MSLSRRLRRIHLRPVLSEDGEEIVEEQGQRQLHGHFRRLPEGYPGTIMRIAVLGDVHLIADDDPSRDLQQVRAFFRAGVPAMRRCIAWLDSLELDAVLSVGDLIDWHSEENVALAVDVMAGLRCPWHLTPGNHDLMHPKPGIPAGTYDLEPVELHRGAATACWARHGVAISDRRVTIGGHDVLLVDSSANRIDPGTSAWVRAERWSRPLLISHVPLDRPIIRAFILGNDISRHFAVESRVQAGSPDFFDDCVAARIPTVFTGHLHTPATLREKGTTFHLLDGSFARGSAPPTVAIVETHGDEVRVRSMTAPV